MDETPGAAPKLNEVESARLTTLAVWLLSPLLIVPLLVLAPYLVTLRAAWRKEPSGRWRGYVLASVAGALTLAVATSPLFVPRGVPLALPAADGESSVSLLRAALIVLNAELAAGVAILPLAFASALDTARRHRAG